MDKRKIKIYLLVFLVVALGFFLRVYNINHIPSGIYPDEAVNGEDAYKANLSGNYQLYYPNNEGREGLFMNLIAVCFKFFGISIFSLKFPAIIFSTLSLWGIYLLAKELFFQSLGEKRAQRLALIAAFLTAVSFWSINFARISFRANMLPAVLTFAFYFLFRGIRTQKWWNFALGGILFGLGMHTYTAWRIAPLIPLLIVPIFILTRKDFLKTYWKSIGLFTFLFLLISAPIFYFVYVHPEFLVDHATPTDDISVFSPLLNHGSLFLTLARTISLSLIKYNFVGDMNWRHNYPPYGILDPLTGLAFLWGIIYCLRKFFRLLRLRFSQKIRHPELEVYAFLLFGFFIMLAPEFFTAEGNPHALRSIGTLPFVFIFAALAFDYFWKQTKEYTYFKSKLIQSILIFSLIFIGLFNPIKYFYFWGLSPVVAKSFNKNLTDISSYLKTLPAKEEKIVITSFAPYHSPLDRLPIQVFNLDSPRTTYFFSWQNFDQIKPQTNNFIIILTGKDADTEARLKQVFPNLTLREVDNSFGSVFYVLK